jgi:hypothetical protein
MTVNVYWEPTELKPNCVDTGMPSKFWSVLQKAFHVPSAAAFFLTREDLPTLRGMAALDCNFEQLITAIEKHGGIRVWPES